MKISIKPTLYFFERDTKNGIGNFLCFPPFQKKSAEKALKVPFSGVKDALFSERWNKGGYFYE